MRDDATLSETQIDISPDCRACESEVQRDIVKISKLGVRRGIYSKERRWWARIIQGC